MNTAQKLALTIGILGFVASGGTQLTDIFAPFGSAAPIIVKELVSIAGFGSGVLGIILTFTTGQGGQVLAVREMPGIEKILVNEKANQTLAAMVVDSSLNKIEAIPGAKAAIAETARAAS